MRFLIILILSLIALSSNAQIIKSNAIMELNNMDFSTPCSSCSEWRYSRNTNFLYRWNGTSWIIYNPGSTLNLGLSMPGMFNVSPSSLTGSGTFNVTLNSQTQNTFLAAPSNASGVPSFRTLTPNDLSVAGGLTGTSSAGRVAFYSGTSTLTGDANLTWDNSDKSLSLGGSGVSSSLLTLNSTTRGILIPRMTTTEKNAIVAPATGLLVYDLTLAAFNVYNGSAWVSVGGGLPAGSDGQVQINSNGIFGTVTGLSYSTVANQFLVPSNLRMSGSLIGVSSIESTTSLNSILIKPWAAPVAAINISGGFDDVAASSERTTLRVSQGFLPTSGTAVRNYFMIESIVNQTGGANGITRGVYIKPTLTSAADWRSIQFDNNTGWGLYGNGTANNYLAGNLALGTTSIGARLSIRGSGSDNNAFSLLTQNSLARTLFSVRNDGLAQLGRNTAVTAEEVAQIEIVSDDANTGLAITPKGIGALIFGNPAFARGNNAVDLQVQRSNIANSGATGEASVVGGGYYNWAGGAYSIVAGGSRNTASVIKSTVAGGDLNEATGSESTVVGGFTNKATSIGAFVGGGSTNTASNTRAVVVGGITNTSSGSNSFVGAGESNQATSTWTAIAGGRDNRATLTAAFVGAGQGNQANSSYTGILSGLNNTAFNTSTASGILGGRYNSTHAENSSITGGTYGETRLEGQRAHANNRFSNASDAQTSDVRVMRSVTGPFNRVLSLDGVDTTKLAVLSIATTTNGRIWNARIQCVATVVTQGAGTATAGSSFIQTYDVGIKRIGNTTTLIGGAPIATSATGDNAMSGANFIITADDTNEALKVEFQPPGTVGSDTVIRAIATIYLTELGY